MAKTGWFADPRGRHRLRYRDGRWTAFVADGDTVEQDPTGLREIDKGHRRNGIILGVAAVISLLALVGVVAATSSYNHETSYQQQVQKRLAQAFVREMDSWQLPASIARSTEPDVIEITPTVWVTRSFVPQPGVTPTQAAKDLVAALRAQGYHNSGLGDWDFDCKDRYCDFSITVEGRRIEVFLTQH